MKLYNTKITTHIFSNLEKENKDIITQINGKSIKSFQFKENILNLAKNLNDLGLNNYSKVAILIKDNINFSNIIISSILVGSTIVLLDPAMGKKVLIEKIKSSNVTHLFLEAILYDYLYFTKSELLNLDFEIIIDGFSIFGYKKQKFKKLLKVNNTESIFIDSDENSECLIVFTGGTTGNPKGVIHSLSSIYLTMEKIKYFCKDTKVFYADMPHFLLLGLLTNSKVISGPYNIKAKYLNKIIEKFSVDTYFSPPYKYNYFIENNIKVPKILNNILLGSAPIYKGFLEKLNHLLDESQRITCIYGMTEVLPISFIDGREKLKTDIDGDLLGYIIPGITYKILENELYVKGPHQLKRYLGYELNDFVQTGDLIKIVDHKLIMIGRKKDMIIKKEYNIYPSVFEPLISEIPGVLASSMIGIYDEKLNDEKIILFVELANDYNYSKINILSFLTGKYMIDKYSLPDDIIFMKLPTIGRQNKIDKNKLREIYIEKNKLIFNNNKC